MSGGVRAKTMALTAIFLVDLEHLLEFGPNLPVRNLHIVLSLAVVGHQIEEAIVGDVKLEKPN